MNETNNLKYQIMQSKRIIGQGQITNIKQKSKDKKFMLFSDEDELFELDLKFVTPSIVKQIDLEFINVNNFEITLSNNKKQKIWEFEQTLTLKNQHRVIKPDKFQQVHFVNIRLHNNLLNKKRLGIRYVLFQGICDQLPDKKSIKKQQRPTQSILGFLNRGRQGQQYMDKTSNKKSQRRDITQQKQLFRNRAKDTTPKQKLTDFSTFNILMNGNASQIRKQVKYNEDYKFSQKQLRNKQKIKKQKQRQQTQLAIALSRSQQKMRQQQQYQKMEIQQHQQNYQPFEEQKQKSLPQALQKYIQQKIYEDFQPQRTYQVVELTDQFLQNYSDINAKFFQKLCQLQIQQNVRQNQKITNHLTVKHLYGMQIFIDGFPEWKIHEIQHKSKKLGCSILKQLKNYCLAIVSRNLGDKLRKKHKAWTGVKYLKEEYLDDCIKYRSKLSERDYYINF